MPSLPASAAGPDIRHLVMGSEARAGVVSEVTVRVSQQAKVEKFAAILFPTWEGAVRTARNLSRSELCLSMMRVSDARETVVQLGLAGSNPALKLLPRWPKRCLMLLALTSNSRFSVERDRIRAWTEARRNGGLPLPGPFGEKWREKRFRGAYMRNNLWDMGYAVDTLETCLRWSELDRGKAAIEDGILTGMGGHGYVFSHLSHFYTSGCSLYTTYIFPLTESEAELRETWIRSKTAASKAIIAHGGTISHQHGVGTDHKDFLEEEKGKLAMDSIRAGLQKFDPKGLMNPGKLYD